MKDQPNDRLHPIESNYMAGAAVVGFLLMLLLTGGSLFAAFGALALIGGIGWIAHRLFC
ncbi:hypothetical protein [Acidisphaera sp. S103]|uniref:hypothetical protein n=1 Tax=Acidisphaera sp. S103 TaxID=1747223 RepID=UPI00131E6436|nr:hypothetical protein [Acidisphaera sp. S103]